MYMKDSRDSLNDNERNSEEIWKDVHNSNGYYKVSNFGNIKSVPHFSRNNINGGVRYIKETVLKPYKGGAGYLYVALSVGGKKRKRTVHKIVAEAFLENPYALPEVNHIDGDKENNAVWNLEYVSHKDNIAHMVKNCMTKKSTPVLCVETGQKFCSLSEAERITGINRKSIKKFCDAEASCCGYHWKTGQNACFEW